MAVAITGPRAQELSAMCGLHESVIGGFWQDLVDYSGGEVIERAENELDQHLVLDELCDDLYDLAVSSGLTWEVHVPYVDPIVRAKTLTEACSQQQATEMLQLLVAVRSGRWSVVVDVALAHCAGELKPSVRRSLGALSRRMTFIGADSVRTDAQELLDQLRTVKPLSIE